ncbi:MAG TPA: DNA primase [Candidatus Saccharimonadales bacterium]|nr:DNA primase [Candidatus Saccharimonadales bacterium]
MSDSEEVKVKLDIVEVIREYVPVKAVGANFQAVCPFHNEKTPSFVISPDKQIWHCFGCGRGGDVFSFVMEKENMSFIEALRLLAAKAGVVLKHENPEKTSKRSRLLDIMEIAGKYYAHILKSSTGVKAKDYLLARGLKEETIADWRLGYSPDSWSSLYDFLRARPLIGKKYTDEEIMAAGLIIRKEQASSAGRNYYDRFRDRVMFPIWDVNNNIVAFTARINPEKEKTEKMGKYINSPQTDIYDKSRVLFALNKAKGAIKKAGFAIVVEGQMDAISCHNHGFDNVVASSGTALTTEQVTLIKRFTNNLVLSFDMDDAGQMAADRGIKEALAQKLNLKVITLPYGKDPDECLQNNPADFKQAVTEASPMLQYYFQKVSTDLDLNKLENKMLVRDKMFAMIALVEDKPEQGYWLKKISEELDFSETDIREEFAKWQAAKKPEYNRGVVTDIDKSSSNIKPLVREELLSELFLSLIIKFPEFISYSLDSLDPDQVYPTENVRFYKTLIIYYNKSGSLDYNNFRQYLTENVEDLDNFLDKLILLGEKDYYAHTQLEAKSEIIKVVMELKRYFYQKKIKHLEREIATAEKNESPEVGGGETITRLMSELKNSAEELKKLI